MPRRDSIRRLASAGALLGLFLLTGPSARASFWPSAAAEVRHALEEGGVSERRAAIKRAGFLSPALARPIIEKALVDDDLEVRLIAARTARQFGYRSMFARAASSLKSRHASERIEVVRLLAMDQTEDVLSELETLAGDSDARVREAVAAALGRVPSRFATRASAKLLGLVDDLKPSVRAEAAASLGRVGTTASAVALASRLQDPEPEVRLQVAVALGAIGSDAVVPALLVSLSDRREEVVAAVARSLGFLGAAQAVPGLISVAEKAQHRRDAADAAKALIRIDTKESRAAVVELLATPERRNRLEPALRQAGAVDIMSRCIASYSGEPARYCAMIHLESDGEPEVVLKAHREGRLSQEHVLQLFFERPHPSAIILALELLGSPSEAAFRLAIDFLKNAEELPPEAAEPIAEALRTRAKRSGQIIQLLGALSRVSTGGSHDAVETFLESSDPGVRTAAARTLVSQGIKGEELKRLILGRGSWLRGALEAIGQGASSDQAATLVSLVVAGQHGRRQALLNALWALPSGLPQSTVNELLGAYRGARGADRDAFFRPLLRNMGSAQLIELLGEATSEDKLLAAQMCWYEPKLLSVARHLAQDTHPHVVALAQLAVGRHGSEADVRALGQSALDSGARPYFVRASALQALAELALREQKVEATDGLLGKATCGSPSGAVRARALRLAAALGESCAGAPLEDVVLHDVDSRLRRVAALLLVQTTPRSDALRRCLVYEPRPEVAAACRAGGESHQPTSRAAHEPPFQLVRLKNREGRAIALSPATVLVHQFSEAGPFPLSVFSDRAGDVMLPEPEASLVDGDWYY